MPMNNREITDYNQTLIQCEFCPSKVQRLRMSIHKSKVHQKEVRRENARPPHTEAQFRENRPSAILEPVWNIVPNDETENWDDSDYPTYNPLVATENKKIIRASYFHGLSKQTKQKCREYESARWAKLEETNQSVNSNRNTCEQQPTRVSTSVLGGGALRRPYAITQEDNDKNRQKFETSVILFLQNLSDLKRAEVERKFTEIMKETQN